ncbi:hypothetical protein [Lentisalinibacter orientalis]|uniref:hypothetical protein n=1 Tax=Lentisalinibacter orientalis TaxID=2992241 RepID=UPI00386404F1
MKRRSVSITSPDLYPLLNSDANWISHRGLVSELLAEVHELKARKAGRNYIGQRLRDAIKQGRIAARGVRAQKVLYRPSVISWLAEEFPTTKSSLNAVFWEAKDVEPVEGQGEIGVATRPSEVAAAKDMETYYQWVILGLKSKIRELRPAAKAWEKEVARRSAFGKQGGRGKAK